MSQKHLGMVILAGVLLVVAVVIVIVTNRMSNTEAKSTEYVNYTVATEEIHPQFLAEVKAKYSSAEITEKNDERVLTLDMHIADSAAANEAVQYLRDLMAEDKYRGKGYKSVWRVYVNGELIGMAPKPPTES